MDQAPCDKPLVNEISTKALFSTAKKCSTKIKRNALPHSCLTCHCILKDGTRCTNTADTKKAVFCTTHVSLENNH